MACSHLAFLVSSATWPEASKPVMVPAEKRLIELSQYPERMRRCCQTHKDNIQFHAGGAPVPLSGRHSEYAKEEGGILHTGIPESLLSGTEAVGL